MPLRSVIASPQATTRPLASFRPWAWQVTPELLLQAKGMWQTLKNAVSDALSSQPTEAVNIAADPKSVRSRWRSKLKPCATRV